MTEPKRPMPRGYASTDDGFAEVLVADVHDEDDGDDSIEDVDLDGPDDVELTDVVWVPPEQPAKRGSFALYQGNLALLAICDDCGETTHTTPEEHLFVPCAHCPGEITLTWEPGEG